MAVKNAKQTVEPIVETKPTLNESVDSALNAIAPGLNIEDMIADQLLDSIDWQHVRASLIRKAPQKLFAWLQSQILPIDGSVPIITNEIESMAIYEGESND